MQVEEDPSSQFVDFTNATSYEQFISDIEQTLIGWHLSNKGHASAEALAATDPKHTATRGAYTRILEMEQTQHVSSSSSRINYALTLLVASTHRCTNVETIPSVSSFTKSVTQKWQQGCEHFTPTMLAVADSENDLAIPCESFVYDLESHITTTKIVEKARKWFGFEEFLFLTRTSMCVDKSFVSERQMEGDETCFDGQMDANEANLVLSAVHIALQNCNCTIPVLIPIESVIDGTWIGSAVPGSTGNASMTMETDSVPEVNSNQSCISGLIDFFELKLQLPPHVEEKCRLAAAANAKTSNEYAEEDLSLGMWVSAAFHYKWIRNEDPRELDKQSVSVNGGPVLDWRVPEQSQPCLDQITTLLFGSSRTHLWGAANSPINAMQITARWPILREGTYVDNAVHSTLDPLTAPEWNICVDVDRGRNRQHPHPQDPAQRPTMPLSRMITNLVHAYAKSRELSRDVLVSELAPTMSQQTQSQSSNNGINASDSPSNGSSRLPESIPAARAAVVLGNAIGSITSTIVSAATWKGTDVEEIRRIVDELFEDAESETNEQKEAQWNSVPSNVQHGAPVGELVSVLACRMGQLQGVNAMSLLWVEFVKSLRERWFQRRFLPFMRITEPSKEGDKEEEYAAHLMTKPALDAQFLLDSVVDESTSLPVPDFHQCLLHQKLQLLNCCIHRQIECTRETNIYQANSSSSLKPVVDFLPGSRLSDLTAFAIEGEEMHDDGSHSDEEFFDSMDQDSSTTISSVAEGVRRVVPGLFCLHTNAMMMEPWTQMAVPLTEDVAKEQQELLARLGGSMESALLRQQIQSAALVSDMQAFKAANPGACVADFIRWYSPKDWIAWESRENELPVEGKGIWWFEGKGMLSERMRQHIVTSSAASTQHLWLHLWDSHDPLPVTRQKRLFDPVEESEKLFHYLETMAPHEMFHQMLVGAISSSIFLLEHASRPNGTQELHLEVVEQALSQLKQQCHRAVSLLDDAFAESQVSFTFTSIGREHKQVHVARAQGQLQVAFEMALDACWKMAHALEDVELMISHASALLKYFTRDNDDEPLLSASWKFVNELLRSNNTRNSGDERNEALSELLKEHSALRYRIAAIVLHNPSSRDPFRREYILRYICPRPYLDEYHYLKDDDIPDEEIDSRNCESSVLDLMEESPVVVNRMYAMFTKETVRFAFTLSESEF